MMPARDDALTFGPVDLMAIKRAHRASGHRLVVIGMVWEQRMKCEWLPLKFTTSLSQTVPALFFSYREHIYYKYWHKAVQGSAYCCQSFNSEMFSAENSVWVSLCVRSLYLMHEGLLWHFIWLLLYPAFSLLLYLATSVTQNQPRSTFLCSEM